MNLQKLKIHATLLENAIKKHANESEDVKNIFSFHKIWIAINDAKECHLIAPRHLGLDRWKLESNLGDCPEVSLRFSQFKLLALDLELPQEDDD